MSGEREMKNGTARLPCAGIRPALVAYVTGELGVEQSWLVREHLRGCAACAAEAARLERTLAALKSAPETPAPTSLKPSSWRRLRRAILHPVIDWIYEHHRLVAWATALAILAAVLAIAWACRIKPDMVIYWLH